MALIRKNGLRMTPVQHFLERLIICAAWPNATNIYILDESTSLSSGRAERREEVAKLVGGGPFARARISLQASAHRLGRRARTRVDLEFGENCFQMALDRIRRDD